MAALAVARPALLDSGRGRADVAGIDSGRFPRCARLAGAPPAFLMLNALGVGVDLVEVDRARRMIAEKGSHVFDRLLTPAEAEYCRSRPDPAEHVAVRLAAKEAVYKALQGSDAARGIGWREIEVVREQEGRPQVTLHGLAAQRAKELKATQVMLSLSHTHQAAVAVAIVVALPIESL